MRSSRWIPEPRTKITINAGRGIASRRRWNGWGRNSARLASRASSKSSSPPVLEGGEAAYARAGADLNHSPQNHRRAVHRIRPALPPVGPLAIAETVSTQRKSRKSIGVYFT